MHIRQIMIAVALAVSALSVGCATHDNRDVTSSSSNYTRYGVIDAIDSVPRKGGIGGSGIGAGAVIGGVVGGVLGNQVGSGTGKTVATVVGAAGGAAVGNEIQKRRNADNGDQIYQLRVRLNDGGYHTVTQADIADLRVGDRVRIENGTVYRY